MQWFFFLSANKNAIESQIACRTAYRSPHVTLRFWCIQLDVNPFPIIQSHIWINWSCSIFSSFFFCAFSNTFFMCKMFSEGLRYQSDIWIFCMYWSFVDVKRNHQKLPIYVHENRKFHIHSEFFFSSFSLWHCIWRREKVFNKFCTDFK